MDKAVSDSIEKQLRSAFPAGKFMRVDVLGYGDDPDVEPWETAVRAFIDQAASQQSWEDDEKVLQAFEKAHGQETKKLHHAGLLPSVAWIRFIPDSPARRASRDALYGFPSMFLGMRSDVADEADGFASVCTFTTRPPRNKDGASLAGSTTAQPHAASPGNRSLHPQATDLPEPRSTRSHPRRREALQTAP